VVQALDLVQRHALEPDRTRILSGLPPHSRAWLEQWGFAVTDEALWLEALTHGSTGAPRNYERLEFLGDRVLGLSIADWLYHRDGGPEGALAQRLNALVSGQVCADIAREIGVPDHVILGKQARDDGAADSDNVLGDIMESLLGAGFLQHGFEAMRDVVHRLWQGAVAGRVGRAKHPKSALQEWAAGCNRKPPEYELIERAGPDHAARFTVRARVRNVGEVVATASSKQEAETAAARLFMEKFG
jgi:ribonuclease-3